MADDPERRLRPGARPACRARRHRSLRRAAGGARSGPRPAAAAPSAAPGAGGSPAGQRRASRGARRRTAAAEAANRHPVVERAGGARGRGLARPRSGRGRAATPGRHLPPGRRGGPLRPLRLLTRDGEGRLPLVLRPLPLLLPCPEPRARAHPDRRTGGARGEPRGPSPLRRRHGRDRHRCSTPIRRAWRGPSWIAGPASFPGSTSSSPG